MLQNSILFYLSVASLIFLGSTLIMVFLFGLSMSKALKNKTGMIVLIVFSLVIPCSIGLLTNRPSAQLVSIRDIEIVEIDDQNYLISYTTDTAEISYIKIGEPILPTYTLQPRKDHSVIIPKYKITAEGEVEIISGGNVYEYKINGK